MATGPQIIGETAAATESFDPVSGPVEVSHPRPATVDAQPEFGGRDGPEPTRYGDWEKNGRCIDF